MADVSCNTVPYGYGPPVTLIDLDGVHKYVRLPIKQYDKTVVDHDGRIFHLTNIQTAGGWRVYKEIKA